MRTPDDSKPLLAQWNTFQRRTPWFGQLNRFRSVTPRCFFAPSDCFNHLGWQRISHACSFSIAQRGKWRSRGQTSDSSEIRNTLLHHVRHPGSILENHRKERLSSIAVGAIYHTERRLPNSYDTLIVRLLLLILSILIVNSSSSSSLILLAFPVQRKIRTLFALLSIDWLASNKRRARNKKRTMISKKTILVLEFSGIVERLFKFRIEHVDSEIEESINSLFPPVET